MAEIPFRGGGFSPRAVRFAGAATLLLIVAAWQGAASAGLINTRFLPPPLAIGRALVALGQSGELWAHLSASLQRFALGWAMGTAAGLVLGFAIGLFTLARAPGMAVVSALFPIPKIALAPLFIIWFGIGEGSKLATLAFGVFFPTVINTVAGVDSVPRGLIRMGQSFGLSRAAILAKIVLPGALPAILSGFRITTSTAVILLVAAEMIGADKGIGSFVLQAGNLYDTDGLMAGIVMLSALGLTVAWLLGVLERRLLAWR
jgi:ABC-type nitrate/sulfonate/bicarbonate transport system permease component